METKDARKLDPKAQEALRIRAVDAVVNQGMRQVDVCKAFNVGRTALHNWLTAYSKGGVAALRAKKRGRRAGGQLKGHQAATVVRIITDRCPDQMKLPYALWTREAVGDLIEKRCHIRLSLSTVGRYLRRWGFTPQKPIRRAYERDPQAVQQWLDTEYPAIRQQAKAEGAEILWGDQMGLRSDHHTGRTYGRRGCTPVVPATGQRFGCNMMSAISNRGQMSFMVYTCPFTVDVMVDFLQRLMRQRKRSVYLIVDRHPVHRARKVQRWVAEQSGRLKIFYLPSYSPELNPDEFLNNDVKANALNQRHPRNRSEMVGDLRSYLRSTQHRPDIVQSYFRHKDVIYAA